MFVTKHWTRFPGRPYSHHSSGDIRVTISPRGVIYLNEKAWDGMGRPEAVEMMFDKGRRMIGLVPSDMSVPEAFPVKDKPGTRGKVISASAFCNHFLIKFMRTGQFNEVEIDHNRTMTLAIDTITAVTRGAR